MFRWVSSPIIVGAFRHIQSAAFVNGLVSRKIDRFYGVPDSLMKPLIRFLVNSRGSEHFITVNEGSAVGLAIGHHLATGRSALVYLQNSGLGNAVNPLVSLCAREVCRIPLVLLIGWRSAPGVKDEPQHLLQGKITLGMLDLMNIPYEILESGSDIDRTLDKCVDHLEKARTPFALATEGRMGPLGLLRVVAKKDTFQFADKSTNKFDESIYPLKREEALKIILDSVGIDDCSIVSTTGMLSRELFETGIDLSKAFLTVGGMGHAASIAHGIAISRPDKKVVCLDGDGASLMHFGSVAQIGHSQLPNFVHFIMNNGSHDSVGGQPTLAREIPQIFGDLAKSAGYRTVIPNVIDESGIRKACARVFNEAQGPSLVEIRIRRGNRNNLKRPPEGNPEHNKDAFVGAHK